MSEAVHTQDQEGQGCPAGNEPGVYGNGKESLVSKRGEYVGEGRNGRAATPEVWEFSSPLRQAGHS